MWGILQRLCCFRLARLAKLSEDHLFYARHFKCPVCDRRALPGRVQPASGFERPAEFNMVLHVDLRGIHDIKGAGTCT